MTTVRPESRPHERPQFSSLHTNKGTESPQIDTPNPSTGEYQEYTSIQDLWESVRRLQYELEMARPKEPLSGRIIQVVYSLPFNFTPRKEHDHIQRKAHAEAAKNSVARMAATARARKLQREQHGLLEAKKAEKTSILDSMDVDPIQKNQEHVGRVAGRRAWMLSELVDDDVSEDDQLSAINSHIHKTSSSEFKEIPSSSSKCTGFSEQGGTSSCTPGSTKLRRPPWILSLSRGHSALNSGIYSLCASHKQTYIGAPIHMRFFQQSELDTRSEVSQTTPEERKEIEAVLASLENRSTWSLHEGGLAMRPPDLDSDNNEDIAGIRYVPTWLDHQSAYSHYEAYCKASTYTWL